MAMLMPHAMPEQRDTIPITDGADKRPYKSAALYFGGFSQRRGTDNGIFAIADEAYRTHAPDCWVQYFPWLADVDSLARLLEGMATKSSREYGQPNCTPILEHS